MSNQSDSPFAQRTAVVSLVAALTCTFAGNAAASLTPAAAAPGEMQFSARVKTLVDQLRRAEPTLPRTGSVAEFRN
jgi:hypothetical protein